MKYFILILTLLTFYTVFANDQSEAQNTKEQTTLDSEAQKSFENIKKRVEDQTHKPAHVFPKTKDNVVVDDFIIGKDLSYKKASLQQRVIDLERVVLKLQQEVKKLSSDKEKSNRALQKLNKDWDK